MERIILKMVTKTIKKIDENTLDIIWRYSKQELEDAKQEIIDRVASKKQDVDNQEQKSLDSLNSKLQEFN